MKTLVESLFDKDLLDKYPVDLSFLETNNKQERVDIFMTILQLMTDPFHLEEWMDELYHEHMAGFDHLQQVLVGLFKKQGFDSWFNIDANEFEEAGEEMTEEEIESANIELIDFFNKAYNTQTNGYFLIGKGKLPEFIVKMFKATGHWNQKLSTVDTWAMCWWPEYGPDLSFYGCPRGLNKDLKKLLYN